MRLRFGMAVVSALTFAVGGCAAGTAGGGAGAGGGGGVPLAGAAAGEAPVQNNNTRQAETRLGLAMVADGDAAREHYQAALTSAQAAIAQDERNPLPWLQAAQAYVGLAEYASAHNALERAEELRPAYRADVENIREQAWYDIYVAGADLLDPDAPNFSYERAAVIFEDANVINDRRPEVRVVLGQIYLQLGEYDRSVENLRRALEIIRSDRLQEVDSTTAVIWLEQAEEIPPMLAQAFMAAERYEEAVATIRPMLEEDPTNQAYARTLASIYNRLNQPDSMRAVFARMDAAAGGNLSASDYMVMGLSFYEAEDWLGADTYFQAVLRQAPRDRDAAEWLARARFYNMQDQQMGGAEADPALVRGLIEAAEDWVELDPNGHLAYTMLAQALNTAGGNDARLVELIEQIEELPFSMDNLEMSRQQSGATVFADVRNLTMSAGQSVTVRFTFFGENNQQIGTQEATVALPPQDAVAPLQIQFQSSQPVQGYTYTVTTTP